MRIAHRKSYSILTSIIIAALVGFLGFALPSSKSTARAEDKHDHGTLFTGGNLTTGTYYLNSDIEGNVTVSGYVKLCLNGHKITGDGTGSVITIKTGANLALSDCQGGGCITGGTGNTDNDGDAVGGGVFISANSTFELHGGSISGNSSDYGGGVYAESQGYFDMYGGVISNNSARHGGGVYVSSYTPITGGTISGNTAEVYGGGVFITGGTLDMEKGTITDNTANGGGGVFALDCTFKMKNGEITNNTANGDGGGVCISRTTSEITNKGGTFEMSGGKINGNSAEVGGGVSVNRCSLTISGGLIVNNSASVAGGVFYDGGTASILSTAGTFKLSGAPNITGNTKDDGGDSNVNLCSQEIMIVGALEKDGKKAQIGITKSSGSGAFTQSYSYYNKGTSGNVIAPTNYFIADADGYIPALEVSEVKLVSCAATVNRGVKEEIYNSFADAWTAATAVTSATVKMYVDAQTTDALTVEQDKNITLDLNGHTLKYNADDGCSVVIVNGAFTLSDSRKKGSISGAKGDSDSYAGVFVSGGTFTMNGGSISGNVVGVRFYSGAFKVSGAPVISDNTIANVSLASGKTITVAGALTEGAKICISGSGTVATGFTQISNPADVFVSDDAQKGCVYVSDKGSGKVTIDAHQMTVIEAKDATCTEIGWEAYEGCSRCGYYESRVEKPELGHSFSEEYTVDLQPTCTTGGVKSRHCIRCDSVEDVTITEALGHSFGEWTVVKEATETEEGVECRVCGNDSSHVETRAIPKLDPSNKFKSFWIWIIAAGAVALIAIGVVVFIVCRKLRKKGKK